MMKYILFLLIAIGIGCTPKINNQLNIDVQGHRGCRGLMPENTIEAFAHAIHLGVTTLELDVVISADDKVVVSHEAYFNHEISTNTLGNEITAQNEKDFNIYKMKYSDIKKIDVGMKYFSKFPQQQKIKTYKPLLSEVIHYGDSISMKKILYNIEIKRNAALDNQFNPPADKFIDLVMKEVIDNKIEKRCLIQSFDHETIKLMKRKHPKINTAILVGDTDSPQSHLDKLGFAPSAYSPYYQLVNSDLISFCKAKNMKLIPWTINEESSIELLINMGVDGIISDYPDKVMDVLKKKSKN